MNDQGEDVFAPNDGDESVDCRIKAEANSLRGRLTFDEAIDLLAKCRVERQDDAVRLDELSESLESYRKINEDIKTSLKKGLVEAVSSALNVAKGLAEVSKAIIQKQKTDA